VELCAAFISFIVANGGCGATQPLLKDGVVKKLHGDPTSLAIPQGLTRDQKWKK